MRGSSFVKLKIQPHTQYALQVICLGVKPAIFPCCKIFIYYSPYIVLSAILNGAVQAAAVDPIHPLAELAAVGVTGQIRGSGLASGFGGGAGHSDQLLS